MDGKFVACKAGGQNEIILSGVDIFFPLLLEQPTLVLVYMAACTSF